MDFETAIIILVGIASLVLLVTKLVNLCKDFWSLFDHSFLPKGAKLVPDAIIVNFCPQKVQYTKNGAKYRTTVSFSDGFEFITCKTDRADGFLSYEIFISQELAESIMKKAIKAHDRALAKQQKEKMKGDIDFKNTESKQSVTQTNPPKKITYREQ